jgi:ubiquinone/menaquinone biosynthesis C-methylase UbiE
VAEDTAEFWDRQAATFDTEPDHGLLAPETRTAWEAMLLPLLPPPPVDVVDLGCGTGTLSVLLGEAGFAVRGLDLSREMVSVARHKATRAGVLATFSQGDAARPPYPAGSADVVLARHVLWILTDPDEALARWVRLLRPGGRLVLVEGRWSTGAGLSAEECTALVRRHRQRAEVQQLRDPTLWGGPITDERYVLLSRR